MNIDWKDWTPAQPATEAERDRWSRTVVARLKKQWESGDHDYGVTSVITGDSMITGELIPNTDGPPAVRISDMRIRRIASLQLEVKP